MGVRSGVVGGATLGLLAAGCGGAGSGQSPPGNEPACRTYAAAYTRAASWGSTFEVTCTHGDGAAGFDLTCLGYAAPTVEHWASRSDFIDEVAAVGIMRELTFTTGASTLTYEYDSMKRPQRQSSTDGTDVRYDAWDTRGRPTHRITVAGDCPGAEISMTYGSEVIFETVVAGTPCAQNMTYGYDSDGNALSIDYGDGGAEIYTTTSRTTVCR